MAVIWREKRGGSDKKISLGGGEDDDDGDGKKCYEEKPCDW